MKTSYIKLLATLFMCSIMSVLFAQADWGTGNGKGFETPDSPYEIGTAEDLAELFKDFSTIPTSVTGGYTMHGNPHFVLTNDIDMSGMPQTSSINAGGNFYGNIDGRGYAIKNLTIEIADAQSGGAGFINELQGVVKNLGFENFVLTATSQANYTGGIAGRIQGMSGRGIENCYIKGGTITGMQTVGGIAGWTGASDGIVNCYVEADVDGTKFIAGIIGSAGCPVTTSTFFGTVKTTSGNPAAILAQGSGAVTNCFYKEDFIATGSASMTDAATGGTALDATAMALASSYTGFDFSTPIWKMTSEKAILNIDDEAVSMTADNAILFELYPNPSTGIITLVIEQGSSVQVSDLAGVQVLEQAVTVGENIIDLSSVAEGYYLVSIFDGINASVEKLLIK